jgi:hypothetical protein
MGADDLAHLPPLTTATIAEYLDIAQLRDQVIGTLFTLGRERNHLPHIVMVEHLARECLLQIASLFVPEQLAARQDGPEPQATVKGVDGASEEDQMGRQPSQEMGAKVDHERSEFPDATIVEPRRVEKQLSP